MYYIAGSARGLYEANPEFELANRVRNFWKLPGVGSQKSTEYREN